jgi:uncharacterized protein YndB with AHSA1/START domain
VQDDGVIRRTGNTYEMVFRRGILGPTEKVWTAITIPERIADWFPTMTFTPDLRVGASINIAFAPGQIPPGKVVALEPPRLFVYRWLHPGGDGSLVRFELEPDGDGRPLTFSRTGVSVKALDQAGIG